MSGVLKIVGLAMVLFLACGAYKLLWSHGWIGISATLLVWFLAGKPV
jgi:hypothetical protein